MKYNYLSTDIHDVERIVIKREQDPLADETFITKIIFYVEGGEYEVTAYGSQEAMKVEGLKS